MTSAVAVSWLFLSHRRQRLGRRTWRRPRVNARLALIDTAVEPAFTTDHDEGAQPCANARHPRRVSCLPVQDQTVPTSPQRAAQSKSVRPGCAAGTKRPDRSHLEKTGAIRVRPPEVAMQMVVLGRADLSGSLTQIYDRPAAGLPMCSATLRVTFARGGQSRFVLVTGCPPRKMTGIILQVPHTPSVTTRSGSSRSPREGRSRPVPYRAIAVTLTPFASRKDR